MWWFGVPKAPARSWRAIGLVRWFALWLCCSLCLTACASENSLHTDNVNQALASAELNDQSPPKDYVIAPQDKLNINVFKEKDLSLTDVQVDASGQISFPLIGDLHAAGKTAQQLAQDIALRLSEKYLQSPQVSVVVSQSVNLKVTVEGEVKTPGVFQMPGRTTLMQVIAMAGGPGETANLHKVAIIRSINGKRTALLCDYVTIRDGRSIDPVIKGEDVVVMDGSSSKSAWNSLMKSLPLVALLTLAL